MKIDIKNIFEKGGKDDCKYTNERLDIEEVFAEAFSERKNTEEQSGGQQPEENEPVQPDEPQPVEEETEEQENVETEEEDTPEPEIAEQQETEGEPELQEEQDQETAEITEKGNEDGSPEEKPEAEEEPDAEEKPEVGEEPDAGEEAVISETMAAAGDKETFLKRYGWHAGIAAAFIVLIAAVIIYTTMIPKEVEATINGDDFDFISTAHTVEGFLEEQDIEFCSEDYISKPLETFMYDGIELEITHATNFTVTADGKTRDYKSLANTVGEALKDAEIKIGSKDIVTPSEDSLLTKNMEIIINRVEIREETVEEDVPFETVNKDDSSMDEGTEKVVTEGVNGKDKVTYEVTYIDGKESSRKEISRTQITAAVNEVIANGTRINYNGTSYSRKLVVKAYAYTGGGRTAMGTKARVGEIAVDPSVIPLGTNVYIEGVGARRAEDTGGNIKGNTIDIYMDTQSQCISWGVRYVTIYIQ